MNIKNMVLLAGLMGAITVNMEATQPVEHETTPTIASDELLKQITALCRQRLVSGRKVIQATKKAVAVIKEEKNKKKWQAEVCEEIDDILDYDSDMCAICPCCL